MSHSSQWDEDCKVERGMKTPISVTAINWRSYQVEQGLQVGCWVKTVTFSHIHQLEIMRMEQGLQVGCLVKTVTFSLIHQLEIMSGGARVAGGMSGKDCYI